MRHAGPGRRDYKCPGLLDIILTDEAMVSAGGGARGGQSPSSLNHDSSSSASADQDVPPPLKVSPPWIDLVTLAFGGEAPVLEIESCILAEPGAGETVVHRDCCDDSIFQSQRRYQPPYSINIIIALNDLNGQACKDSFGGGQEPGVQADNGCTMVAPESHRRALPPKDDDDDEDQGQEEEGKEEGGGAGKGDVFKPMTMMAGECVAFDSRCRHKGARFTGFPNATRAGGESESRRLLLLSYVKPSSNYKDTNFGTASLMNA